MLKQYKKQFSTTFRVLDLFLLVLSFYIAYYLRYSTVELNIFSLPLQYQVFLPTYLISWVYLSYFFNLYSSKRTSSYWGEFIAVAKTLTLCIFVGIIPSFFVREVPLSRIFLLSLSALNTFIFLSLRFFLREFLKFVRRRGYNYRNILIVGRNNRAEKIVNRIEKSTEFGLRIIGFIDEGNNNNNHEFLKKYKCLGNLDALENIIRGNVVDEVFILLPIKSFYSKIEDILRVCEYTGVEVKISTDLFNLGLAKSSVFYYDDVPVIDLYSSPKMNLQFIIKRVLDIFVSMILLVLFAPIVAVICLLIKITSKGPIHFKQTRLGYNGRPFSCIKFRTMVEDAEKLKDELIAFNEMDGPVFKMKNDPRITKMGSFLRKTSLDELPQLINVLKGEMSLVGPRPPLPEEVNLYDLKDRRRLSMKPGITCLWQINGRNTISFEKWMELDRKYIDQWSLWLDLKILLKTIPAVLKGSGAA